MSESATVGRPRLSARFAAVVVLCFTLLTGLLTAPPAVAALPVNDPNNLQVLVTKSRPLNPLRYIAPDLVFYPGTNFVLRREVSANLQNLFAAARNAGAPLAVVSAYRSYDQQAALYNSYVAQYGQAVADTISARPGHSEHQTGLAVDVGNLDGSCGLGACFANTAGGRWVAANAHRYGFIIRYPNGYQSTTGYTFEPWHLRYVGRSVATEMRTRGIPTMEHYYNGSNQSIKSGTALVAADSAGTLWNYAPNWYGGFLGRTRIGSGWLGLKAGYSTDWNSDGSQDILAQWRDGRLTLYRGLRAGGFAPPIQIGSGWASMDLVVGTWWRGSRYPSVVAKDSTGGLWHYSNTTGGALSSLRSAKIGHGWQGLGIALADWDRDGNQDILATRANGQLVVYRSNGLARFISEGRPVVGTGWDFMDSLRAVSGFQGPGSYGLRARASNGQLRYYPLPGNAFGPRAIIGSGWQNYTILD
ncbi:D-alanyl-D-alanine carboxypeptidase family protein [uncultured Arthrobacter sp.]|uniref:D-alanyl-D-alanine carboxypeptidase family protein n=1 Tax=uncultured Arthrobacter sp. TaxID=114050 RepID=UPI002624A813|nr:D-alanyl-D-alanine carboxypeptidase family protein [uncultured Arthrobacter sp.]